MSFAEFCTVCKKILEKSKESTTVDFENDSGKYTAYFGNGVKIRGNSISRKIGVYWGSGHCSMATI